MTDACAAARRLAHAMPRINMGFIDLKRKLPIFCVKSAASCATKLSSLSDGLSHFILHFWQVAHRMRLPWPAKLPRRFL